MTTWLILGTIFFIVTLWLLWGTSFDKYYGKNKVGEYHVPVWVLLIIYFIYITPVFGVLAFLIFCALFTVDYNRKPTVSDSTYFILKVNRRNVLHKIVFFLGKLLTKTI